MPSDGDGLFILTRLVKPNNQPIKRIGLGDILALSRQARCRPQSTMQSKEDIQCIPRHPETGKANRFPTLAKQTKTHRAVGLGAPGFEISGVITGISVLHDNRKLRPLSSKASLGRHDKWPRTIDCVT